jgi:hypothetical protein
VKSVVPIHREACPVQACRVLGKNCADGSIHRDFPHHCVAEGRGVDLGIILVKLKQNSAIRQRDRGERRVRTPIEDGTGSPCDRIIDFDAVCRKASSKSRDQDTSISSVAVVRSVSAAVSPAIPKVPVTES